MSPLSARRILTALTLVILLCAAPALAAAPRAARRAHVVPAPTQLSIMDSFQNAIAHFIAKITVSGGGGGGVIGGARIDPNGSPTGPGSNPPPAGGTP
ncbi:MAG TPA: hypothetical protein VGS07_11945 [Thermoanaerobaculia bacterium]|nr:hypothetical protein [Thermoanaerobaculia bacterium]